MTSFTINGVAATVDAAPETRIVGWRHRIAAEPVVPYIYAPERWEAQRGFDHFALTGRRLRHLPMGPDVVLEALRA